MGSDWPVVTQLEEIQVVSEEGLTENLVLWRGTSTTWRTLRYRKYAPLLCQPFNSSWLGTQTQFPTSEWGPNPK